MAIEKGCKYPGHPKQFKLENLIMHFITLEGAVEAVEKFNSYGKNSKTPSRRELPVQSMPIISALLNTRGVSQCSKNKK